MSIWAKPVKPTIYFIGVTTTKSSIMPVFPEWAKFLNLGDCEIRGIDFKVHDAPANYRAAVDFIKSEPLALGALVTTHKIDLLKACRDQFDKLDEYADVLGEVSSISKHGNKLVGHAKDPITSGLALEAFLPTNHWAETGAEMCSIGAGGAAIAITCHILQHAKGKNKPTKIVVTNRSHGRLEEIRKIHERYPSDIPVEYIDAPEAAVNDRIVSRLKPGSLVMNATGLGKDAPGSPLTDKVVFPKNGLVWEFNYRGNLVFLDQARKQEAARNLRIEDGWIYFIHGWTRVIAEVFHVDIPVRGPVFDELSNIAASVRK